MKTHSLRISALGMFVIISFGVFALPVQSEDSESSMKQGIDLMEQGKRSSAMEVFKQVLKVDPNHVEARLWLGFIYAERGFIDEALKEYNKAISLAPKDPRAYYAIAAVCEETGDTVNAEQYGKKAEDLDTEGKLSEYLARATELSEHGDHEYEAEAGTGAGEEIF